MAKLSAHGYEVARLSMEGTDETLIQSFRSDGHILRCQKVLLSSGWHNSGWKLHRRFSDRNISPARILASAQRQHARATALAAERGIDGTVTLTTAPII